MTGNVVLRLPGKGSSNFKVSGSLCHVLEVGPTHEISKAQVKNVYYCTIKNIAE